MSQLELQDWRAPLPARALAMAFLSTSGDRPMRTASLIRHAAICGVDGAAMRVALGRLVRDGAVEQVARGAYAIGPGGIAMHRLARGWAGAEERVRAWSGRWVVVAVDHLGRSDRTRRRLRERALELHGFARSGEGLWLRPDNLALPLAGLGERLHALGLGEGAALLGGAIALPEADARYRALWPAAAITAGYRHWIAELADSTRRVATLPPEEAARETLLLGQAVIRAINRDPMLPAELIDVSRRRAMIAAMQQYDRLGKSFWSLVSS